MSSNNHGISRFVSWLFPDTTDDMIDAKFTSKVKSGLFDSDGYFILEAKYNSEDFENEI